MHAAKLSAFIAVSSPSPHRPGHSELRSQSTLENRVQETSCQARSSSGRGEELIGAAGADLLEQEGEDVGELLDLVRERVAQAVPGRRVRPQEDRTSRRA